MEFNTKNWFPDDKELKKANPYIKYFLAPLGVCKFGPTYWYAGSACIDIQFRKWSPTFWIYCLVYGIINITSFTFVWIGQLVGCISEIMDVDCNEINAKKLKNIVRYDKDGNIVERKPNENYEE